MSASASAPALRALSRPTRPQSTRFRSAINLPRRSCLSLLLLSAAALAGPANEPAAHSATAPAASAARYTADGKLVLPPDYREWIFLTSGIDMAYSEGGQPPMHSMFDNIYVPRDAYRAFLASGTWPDGTVLLMEIRGAGSKASINKRGQFQTADVMGFEAHVKDTARFEGGWAFFGLNADNPGAEIPHAAACYSCHQQHAAVDSTFVQFYPTLLPIATAKGTLSASYVADENALAAGKSDH